MTNTIPKPVTTKNVTWVNTVFKDVHITGWDFAGSTFTNCDFSGSTMSQCIFANITFNNCNLSNMTLQGTSFTNIIGIQGTPVDFGFKWINCGTNGLCLVGPGCDLTDMDLRNIIFLEVDFTEAILTNAQILDNANNNKYLKLSDAMVLTTLAVNQTSNSALKNVCSEGWRSITRTLTS